MQQHMGPGADGLVALSPHTVLVVDDEVQNLALFSAHLEDEGHVPLTAGDGQTAVELARSRLPDLILLDLMLPGMSGVEVAAHLKSDDLTRHIPIIMITGSGDRASKLLALRTGVEEFLEKPVERAEFVARVRNLLRLKHYQDLLETYASELEKRVEERTREIALAHRETIFTLTRAAEYKDEETGAHVHRMGHYARLLAETLGMDATFTDHIFHASPMHDVGKIGIPDAILLKPGGFDPGQWEVMKTHTLIGAAVLAAGSSSPYVAMGAQIARSHHEAWDGSGYPDRLRGEQIPLAARIVTIGDVYDALRSRRPYKRALSHQDALDIILSGDGRTHPGQFDPAVLAAFRAQADTFAEIFERHQE